MKKYLLLLITTITFGQTYQNPTYGTVTTKTNTESATANRINVQETSGLINWLQPINIPIPTSPSNYVPTAPTLGGHLAGIDTKLGSLSGTTAGISTRVWFTADQTTITAGTFDLTNPTSKGTAASHIQTVANNDDERKYFPTDLIGQPFAMITSFPAGTYAGNLTVSTTPTNANQKFTVELYRCNNAGTPIASGVAGAVVGSLGVTVIMIMDSGEVTLANASVTNVAVSTVLGTGGFTINTGERIRYHVSAAKAGSAGGVINESVYYGTSYNSFIDVPVIYNSSSIKDVSTVTNGSGTVTDALNTLNAGKQEYFNQEVRDTQSERGSFLILGDSFTEGVGASDYLNGFSSIVTKSMLNASDGLGYSSTINQANELAGGLNDITTNGAFVSSGVTGSRLQLTAGKTITITNRNASYISVIYDGSVSSGTLEFRKNGVLYDTKTISGSVLASTANSFIAETYLSDVITITATGTAVITSIIAVRDRQKYSMPFIVGKAGTGYQDFTSASALDEIAFYLNYVTSSKKTVILALGTNNLYNAGKALSPTAMTAQTALVIAGIKARCTNVDVLITVPAKSNESVYPIITGGFSYTDYVNEVVNFCKANGYTAIRYDKTQMGTGATAYLSDNVHPNNTGHLILANKINETLGVVTDAGKAMQSTSSLSSPVFNNAKITTALTSNKITVGAGTGSVGLNFEILGGTGQNLYNYISNGTQNAFIGINNSNKIVIGSNSSDVEFFSGGAQSAKFFSGNRHIVFQNGGTFADNEVDRLQVTGTVLSTGFKVAGATGFLKSDGTVDTNSYAVNSGVIHTTGNETKTGTLVVTPSVTSAIALQGNSGSNAGVSGTSNTGVGVSGTSQSGNAGVFNTISGSTVAGFQNDGVTTSSITSAGVFSGTGVNVGNNVGALQANFFGTTTGATNNYIQLITSSDGGKGMYQGIDITSRLFYWRLNDSNDYGFSWQNNSAVSLFNISNAGVVKIPNLGGSGDAIVGVHSDGTTYRTAATTSLKYVALLTQTGTGAPVATVIENTLGGTVVWSRTTTGIYVGTLTGAFTTGKTIVLYGNSVVDTAMTGYSNSVNTVSLSTSTLTNTLKDGALVSATIKIEVYP